MVQSLLSRELASRAHGILGDLSLIPLSFAPTHSRSIKQGSKDCWQLVEALGSATWPISHCIFNKGWVDKTTNLRFPNFLFVERR
jgi:hypothetical protein